VGSKGLGKHTVIIIIVIVAIVFLLIVGGLIAYIFMLRTKNAKRATSGSTEQKPTELKQMSNNNSTPDFDGKAELPVQGGMSWELPSNPATQHANPAQQPWSPHTPAQPYPYTAMTTEPTRRILPALELPGSNRRSGKWAFTELPG
jgi:hypothetical protein